MISLSYIYAAEVLRVVDGDTMRVRIDLGFGIGLGETLRLYGINTPETSGAKAKTEKAAGLQAKDFVETWLANLSSPRQVIVASYDAKELKQEKYGRWLARVFNPATQECLNEALVKNGMAVEVKY